MTTIIADDDKTLLLLHTTFLKRNGISDSPLTCLNGHETIEILNSIDSEESVLLFLDLNMPVLDGWDVLDFIQKNSARFARVNVIVVTSSICNDDKTRALQYDCVKRYVVKPMSSAVLDAIKKEFVS